MLPLKQERSPKGNENRENCQNPLPFHGRSGRKGNVNGETQRNSLPLKQERSPKGSVNRETQRNPLPFDGRSGRKGNVNGGTQRNSLPFHGRSGRKGNVNRETQRNPLPFHQLFLDLGRTPSQEKVTDRLLFMVKWKYGANCQNVAKRGRRRLNRLIKTSQITM